MRQLLILLLLLLTLWSCGDTAGATDTGNAAIAGIIYNAGGIATEGVIVSLVPQDFNPLVDLLPDSLKDTTDSNGKYFIDVADSGLYNLVTEPFENEGLLVRAKQMIPNDTIELDGQLKALQIIAVSSPFENNTTSGDFYVKGTPYKGTLSGNANQVTIPAVYPGPLPAILFNSDQNSEEIQVFADNEVVVTESGDNSFGETVQWKYRKQLVLNTAASGSNTVATLYNFPVSLVLKEGDFAFAQALSTGADIRFRDNDGEDLTFTITSWDSTAGEAELWVKLDSLLPQSETQSINLYWGNTAAVAQSSAPEVFDTTNGYRAVWHMTKGSSVLDDTYFGNHGTPVGMTKSEGVIGDAGTFDGDADDNYVEITPSESLRPTKALTFSGWIKTSRTPDDWEAPFGHIYDLNLLESGFALAAYGGQLRFMVVTKGLAANTIKTFPGVTATVGEWMHIVGTYDGTMLKLYSNGVEVGSKDLTGDINWEYIPAECRIGMFKDSDESEEFAGSVDEFQILNTAVSADWVKATYFTQKNSLMK